jgi:phage shock protein PspC (stress-responsive transcriptional regulator)
MNKVTTVNLNGIAYQVEENGYAALEEYLTGAAARLRGNPDLAEIMADLEQAIADKCNKLLTPRKNVVTGPEIAQILKEMGPVEADTSGAEEEAGGTGKQEERTSAAPKRLYLIREGAMIAGVCTGLAVYFNIDVTWIRLAFAVLAIVSAGILVPAYFVAMIVIPPADTLEKKAEAHGAPFNAQEVVDRAKAHYSSFKEGAGSWWRKSGAVPAWMKSKYWCFRTSPQVDMASHILSMVMLPLFGVIMGGLTLLWVLGIISLVNTGAVFGWPLPPGVPMWAGILILIFLYSVVIGPFKMAFHSGYLHQGRYYGWPGILGGLVWMICLILAVATAYAYLPEVRDFVENLPSSLGDLFRKMQSF